MGGICVIFKEGHEGEILRCLSERDPEVWGSNGEGPVTPALMFGLGERV